MEVRCLARSLRARPSPWLLSSRQHPTTMLQRHILSQPANGLRYSSTDSPSQSPAAPSKSSADRTTTATTTAKQTPTPPKPAEPPTMETTSQPNSPSQETSTTKPKNTNAELDDILKDLNLGTPVRQAPRAGTNAGASSRIGHSIRRIFPDSKQFLSQAVRNSAKVQPAKDSWNTVAQRNKLEMKLGPKLGRHQVVSPERGTDLGSAIRNLEVICAVNRIKHQSITQKYHVRRGIKRKQLRMQRWKKLFRSGFMNTVQKIKRMQTQGW